MSVPDLGYMSRPALMSAAAPTAAMDSQLELPLRDTWNPVTVSRLNRRAPLSTVQVQVGTRVLWLHLRTAGRSAEVRLRCDTDAPGAAELKLHVALAPVFLVSTQSDAVAPLHWGLSRQGLLSDPRDFFGYALRWSVARLGWQVPRGWARPIKTVMTQLLREVAGALSDLLTPPLRAATLRFPLGRRAVVYGHLRREERGWFRQALRAVPGAVLFALALAQYQETEEAGVRLALDLKDGRRLDAALAAAISSWRAALVPWARSRSSFNDSARRAFAAAAYGAVGGGAELERVQRLLVRRAGPMVEPSLLLLPPPARLVPEDIPGESRPNADWYQVMKVPGATMVAVGHGQPAGHCHAFAAFASCNTRVLRAAPPGIALETWLCELSAVLHAQGRSPARSTDASALVASIDVDALRRRDPPEVLRFIHPLDRIPEAVELVEELETPAPPPGDILLCRCSFREWKGESIEVRQLTTLRELRAEAARQHNCVESYAGEVSEGDTMVFTVQVRGKPLTLALVRRLGRLFVSEFKGFANRRASKAEWTALGSWLRFIGVQ